MTINQTESSVKNSFFSVRRAKAFLNKSTFPIDQSLFIPVAIKKNELFRCRKVVFFKG